MRADPMASSAHQGITRTGALLGSPLYMPPEQVMGIKEVDPRSDIFSLGVTMYEALCGVTPNHECDTIGMLVLAICSGKGQPIAQRAPAVPRAVAVIVDKALALDPNLRFQTTTEMQQAIAALLPEGSSLHESMLAAAGPAQTHLQSTIAMPFAQTPRGSSSNLREQPTMGLPLPSSGAAGPGGAGHPIASTAVAFAGTDAGTSKKTAAWTLLVPLALLAAGGGGSLSTSSDHARHPSRRD